jgi:putative ABC transport system ATP-binding protein
VSELVVEDLSYERAGRTIFDRLSFTVRSGEQLAVQGASGSGKTSLLAILAGFSAGTGGAARFDGRMLDAVVRKDFAVVLQGFGLVPLLSAAENVEVALRAAGRSPAQALDLARDALDQLDLGSLAENLVEDLSGGQQQRVAVARALALRPAVLLADEPTAEQDPASRALVLERLLDVGRHGGILVLATHDPAVAARCSGSLYLHPQPKPPS